MREKRLLIFSEEKENFILTTRKKYVDNLKLKILGV